MKPGNWTGLLSVLTGALLLGACLPTPAPATGDGSSGNDTPAEPLPGGTNGGGGAGPGKQYRLAERQVAPNPRLGLAFPGKITKSYRYLSEARIGIVRLSVPWSRRGRGDGPRARILHE